MGGGSKYLDIQLPCGSAIELVFDVETMEAAQFAAIDARLGEADCRRSHESPHRGG